MNVTRHPLFLPKDPLAQRVPPDDRMIGKLQGSLNLLIGDDGWTARFYELLFRDHPGLRGLFPEEMTEQRRKLRETLGTVIAHLRDPAAVRARLLELGRSHVGYGARAEHYPLVVNAMVAAMREAGGPAWSDDLTAEWRSALEMVAAIMAEGAAGASEQPFPSAEAP